MLLHDFLRRKATILKKAKAEVDNLLTEISDPKTKEAVDDWEPGDPISDEYAQVDHAKKEEPALAKAEAPELSSLASDTHLEDHGTANTEGATGAGKPTEEPVKDTESVAAPIVADTIAPAIDEIAKPDDNTNHTA